MTHIINYEYTQNRLHMNSFKKHTWKPHFWLDKYLYSSSIIDFLADFHFSWSINSCQDTSITWRYTNKFRTIQVWINKTDPWTYAWQATSRSEQKKQISYKLIHIPWTNVEEPSGLDNKHCSLPYSLKFEQLWCNSIMVLMHTPLVALISASLFWAHHYDDMGYFRLLVVNYRNDHVARNPWPV